MGGVTVDVSPAPQAPQSKPGGRHHGGLACRLALGGTPFLAVIMMSACTGGESDASPSTVPRIGATNYVTQPMITLPGTTVPGQTTPAGGTAREGQEYRIRPGDSVFAIANRYGITPGQLAEWNNWQDGPNHNIIPGDIIKIPPFAEIPGEPSSTVPGTELIGGPICLDGTEQETYEIQSNDYVGRVAEELDVSVEELDEVNAVTPGYSSFYPGLEILVPCPAAESDGPTATTIE